MLEIRPCGPIRGRIRPPGSKSITLRAMLCAALAEGESLLVGAADCDDAHAMQGALQALAAQGEQSRFRGVNVPLGSSAFVAAKIGTVPGLAICGCGGRLAGGKVELWAADSGAAARFLMAAAALGHGEYRIDGSPQLRRRPMRDLLDALRQLGVDAVAEQGNGRLPAVVRGRGLRGGQATVAGEVSSQFASALAMAAPYAQYNMALTIAGEIVSRPFLDMTLAVMRSFGAEAAESSSGHFVISAPRAYRGRRYDIEPDATAAGYFLAAAAMTQGEVFVEGLARASIQGDIAFCDCLRRMGCRVQWADDGVSVQGGQLRGIEADLRDLPDAAPTLAVAALVAKGPTTIRGAAHLRHKESDRIAALAAELRKLGGEIHELDDGLKIIPGKLHGALLDPHGDHRLAMSFALAGLIVPGVAINNPQCVEKTYPAFFRDLQRLVLCQS
jgi:3-phosphoshikimate 1-carboxyvinyltransferase